MPGLPRGIAAAGALCLLLVGLEGCAGVARPPAPAAPPPPVTPRPEASPPAPGAAAQPVRLEPLSDLEGWAEEDHVAALEAFRRGCGAAKAPSWRAVCRRARAQSAEDEASARAFFEDNFRAEVGGATGLLTGYFAPEYAAREEPDEIYTAPVLPKPDDLVVMPGADGGRRVYRSGPDGLAPYPDRAAIEALPVDHALAFMKPEELFFLQVQGSGSLVFPDGRREKVVYAADNGRPFLGIARPMSDAGLLTPAKSSADGIRSWLADHRGAEAISVMDQNPRYVFFRVVPDDRREPAGSAGVELPPGRALAVDPSRHAYGELYWIDASAPVLSGAVHSYRRLAVALDSGSAIRGEVRADLYLGRGEEAGLEAGRIRHSLRLIRLTPVDRGERSGFGRDAQVP